MVVISIGLAYTIAKSNNYNNHMTAPTKSAHEHCTVNINFNNNVTYSDSLLHVYITL